MQCIRWLCTLVREQTWFHMLSICSPLFLRDPFFHFGHAWEWVKCTCKTVNQGTCCSCNICPRTASPTWLARSRPRILEIVLGQHVCHVCNSAQFWCFNVHACFLPGIGFENLLSGWVACCISLHFPDCSLSWFGPDMIGVQCDSSLKSFVTCDRSKKFTPSTSGRQNTQRSFFSLRQPCSPRRSHRCTHLRWCSLRLWQTRHCHPCGTKWFGSNACFQVGWFKRQNWNTNGSTSKNFW